MPSVYGILFLVANVAVLVSSSQITSNHVQPRSAIETPISRCDIRPMATSQLFETSKVCRHTQCPPEVTVAEYGSLVVNWEKSFEDCETEEVRGALVRIDSKDVRVNFVEGKAKVTKNTCLAQIDVKVELQLATTQVHSLTSQYRPTSTATIAASAKRSSAATSKCKNTMQGPKVTVFDSKHLLVNWAESFKECDIDRVKSASVEIPRSELFECVNFADKEAKIKANPCLKHLDIKIRVLMKGGKEVWSHGAQYNDYLVNPKLEELYSGLFQKPIHDKICGNANVFALSDVPDEIKQCMKGSLTINRGEEDVFFSFTIVDPSSELKPKVVKDTYKKGKHCTPGNNGNTESPQGPCRPYKQLKVTVNSETHLYVNWTNSFNYCEKDQIAATKVIVDDKPILQLSGAVEAMVEADPCLRHKIEVTLEMKKGSICPGQATTQESMTQSCKLSQVSHYNFYHDEGWNIKNLYSGLLRGKFIGKLCAKFANSNGSESSSLQIPEVPVELNRCVFSKDIKRKGQNHFTVPIVNPNGQGRSNIIVNCNDMSIHNEVKQPNSQSQSQLPAIIGGSIVAIVLVILVVVILICLKKKQQSEADIPTDVNPVYEGAADYDYDEMNYDTMGNEDSVKVTVKKKEVQYITFYFVSIFWFCFNGTCINPGESRGS